MKVDRKLKQGGMSAMLEACGLNATNIRNLKHATVEGFKNSGHTTGTYTDSVTDVKMNFLVADNFWDNIK